MKNILSVCSLDEMHLFPSEKIWLRNSMDRYGFSHLLAGVIGIRAPKRSFCNWVHGWVWWESIMKHVDILMILPTQLSNDVPIIVATDYERKIINDQKFKNQIYVGGLPFAYCPDLNVKKQHNTLLAVLAHSAEAEIHDVLDEDYLDYLHSIKDKWESIYVLIYYLDKNEELVKAIEKRGLQVIEGANPYDKFSLLRTKLIFTLADAVNSNVMGSHIAYALACNCKVSLTDNLYSYDRSVTLKANQGLPLNDIERFIYAYSSEYLKEHFNYLFVNPSQSKRNKDLGQKFIGHKNVLSNKSLKKALGWNLSQQVSGFTKGFFRRSKKIIFTK